MTGPSEVYLVAADLITIQRMVAIFDQEKERNNSFEFECTVKNVDGAIAGIIKLAAKGNRKFYAYFPTSGYQPYQPVLEKE